MENGLSGGGGGGGGGGGLSEIDFQRLAQIIATSIQKVQQNGEFPLKLFLVQLSPMTNPTFAYSLHHAAHGQSTEHAPGFPGTEEATVSDVIFEWDFFCLTFCHKN